MGYWKNCDAACAVDLLSVMSFPDWRPQAARTTILAVQNVDPVVRYLFHHCEEDEEVRDSKSGEISEYFFPGSGCRGFAVFGELYKSVNTQWWPSPVLLRSRGRR